MMALLMRKGRPDQAWIHSPSGQIYGGSEGSGPSSNTSTRAGQRGIRLPSSCWFSPYTPVLW